MSATISDFLSLAPIARRKLAEWSLGKRARAVGSFVISQSFERGRLGVRMFNRNIEAALGMDKGCVSDAIAELITAGVLQVAGRSGAARVFRFLPNAELIEPESRVDHRAAAEALAEIERMNSDGLDVEHTGQRLAPIRTTDEQLAEDLAEGSRERAREAAPFDLREAVLASLRSTDTPAISADLEDLEDLEKTDGAEPSAPRAPFFASPLGTQPTRFPATQSDRLAHSQPAAPVNATESGKAPAFARASISTIGNGANAPQWRPECGAVAPGVSNGSSPKASRPGSQIDEDLLRRVENLAGAANRGYWAVILRKAGQPGARALHEALGELQLRGGAPKGTNASKYLFGIYRRILAGQPIATA